MKATQSAGPNPNVSTPLVPGTVTTAVRARIEVRQHSGSVNDLQFAWIKHALEVWV